MRSIFKTELKSRPIELKSQLYFQILLIVIIISAVILFTGKSFYISLVESINVYGLRSTCRQLCELDLSSDNALKSISDAKKSGNYIIEIYKRSSEDPDVYDKAVYLEYDNAVLFMQYGAEKSTNRSPVIGYKESNYSVIREYSDGVKIGTIESKENPEKFFAVTTKSADGNYLFITSVHYCVIESQARAINYSSLIITGFIFLVLLIVFYFYTTGISEPLTNIETYTKEMTVSKDSKIRIPERKKFFRTEVDETISSINTLYESLMRTQETLTEKSEFIINQLKEKENEQKYRVKFIADISHELKTPIAIIQGYAEGIKYILDDPQSINEYCDTITDECVKMTDLVVKTMSLSNIQHSEKLICSDFLIKDFIDERVKAHEKVFEKNCITVKNFITDNIYGNADLSKLQFVVNNLLSNAVSYADGDEKIIRIRYESLDLAYRIFIFNSGNPIPQSELEALWKSFYRGDEARSRSDGHFGLGLSIVKAVQDAHSQMCGVNNTDDGVEFWFDISKKQI